MTCYKISIAIFLLTFAQQLCAQRVDSTIRIQWNDYHEGKVVDSSDELIRYENGRLIEKFRIDLNKDGCSDSTWIKKEYDEEGKLIARTKKSLSYYNCDEIDFGMYTEETHYSDTIEVKKTISRHNENTRILFDTLYYYPNHLIRRAVSYDNKKCRVNDLYSYTFDGLGRVVETRKEEMATKYKTIQITKDVYLNQDTLSQYWMRFETEDSTSHSMNRFYNEYGSQTAYIQLKNGVYNSSGTSWYDEQGLIKEHLTYKTGSEIENHHHYWWKVSKGKKELWRLQFYQHSRDLNGYYYVRIDTIKTKRSIEIREYHVENLEMLAKQKRPPAFQNA